jgi:hypothetical protein
MKSAIVQWIIKVAISNSGKFVRMAVGALIAVVVKNHIVPDGDVANIQAGLEQGGYALMALAYAAFEFYAHRQAVATTPPQKP